jgi:hypothetical protein
MIMPYSMVLLLALAGISIITGIITGCNESSGGNNSPTGPATAKCEEVEDQCFACEDNTVLTEPSCAAAAACAGGEDFWQCLDAELGSNSACEQAIYRTCYALDAPCDQAWGACAEDECDKANHLAFRCEIRVITQQPSCAGAEFCAWDAGDPWLCIENILGEDSLCEQEFYQMCVQKGKSWDLAWKACFPQNYACAGTQFQVCTAWLQEQPACTAEDRQLIAACAATNDLYSDACWKQDSGVSDPCWETLMSRDDCQFDVCHRQFPDS